MRARIGSARVRADNLWQKYRITPEQYDALRSAQGFRCRICGIHEDDITAVSRGRPRLDGKPAAEAFRLVVDHCHRSGQVRGLLCAHCNAMIGQARDRPDVLRAAAAYLDDADGTGVSVEAVCKLRIIDSDPAGRPPRTVRFGGAVSVRIDGYIVRLTPGETKTVISASGEYEVITLPWS
ncbi:endonuclease VII domain-containing protein [Winogradskya humida]|uniref:endonuclease VII domain-containing protein n=1 Tax=Winogradskya humida TaxID=113566 RepID=UPI0019408084|nr:endonuclease VII domain-containing protein [Actinoplanes humidus]